MGEKKLVKLYMVDENAFNDKGELDPKAKLFPYFGKHYGIRPHQVTETVSSTDEYDNSLNRHQGRVVDVGITGGPDNGVVIKDLVPSKRGYSALSYPTKEDRRGSLLYDWKTRSAFRTEQPDIQVASPDSEHPGSWIFEHEHPHSVRLLDPDSFISEDEIRRDFAEETGNNNWYNNLHHDIAYADRAALNQLIRDWVSKQHRSPISGGRLVTVPMIITADEDDIINFNHVFKEGYSPTRDFLHDTEVRKILNKEYPLGLYKWGKNNDKKELQLDYYNRPLESFFDYYDPMHLSDEQYKFILKDMYEDAKNSKAKRTHNNVCGALQDAR